MVKKISPKIFLCVLLLIPLFFLLPITQEVRSDGSNGNNETVETPIIGEAEGEILQAQKWAYNRGATDSFIQIAPVYWEYGKKTGMRPEVLYAQSAKETAFGNFGRAVTPDMNNWAGIKVGDESHPGEDRDDHETFDTPKDGVRAHFNHMTAYTGLDAIGEPHDRYHLVKTISWAGSINYVEELGGRWAPSPTYGNSIVNHYLNGLLDTKLREYGENRYQTAVNISKKSFPDSESADAVVLGQGDNFPDALAGAPLAHQKNAPLLLTPTDALHQDTADEILRVLDSNEGVVYILGGEAAVGERVYNELKELLDINELEKEETHGPRVTRIGGNNRYETAVLIAEKIIAEKLAINTINKDNDYTQEDNNVLKNISNEDIKEAFPVFLVTGENFPDAVSVSSAASQTGGVVLLTTSDHLHESAANFLDDYAEEIEDIYAIGGSAVISEEVYKQAEATSRIAGDNRWETATQIAVKFFEQPGYLTMATGMDFPDALTGGSYAASRKAPVLLTRPGELPEAVSDYLNEDLSEIQPVILALGGSNAISNDVIGQLKQLLE